jgi:hypothetical protein
MDMFERTLSVRKWGTYSIADWRCKSEGDSVLCCGAMLSRGLTAFNIRARKALWGQHWEGCMWSTLCRVECAGKLDTFRKTLRSCRKLSEKQHRRTTFSRSVGRNDTPHWGGGGSRKNTTLFGSGGLKPGAWDAGFLNHFCRTAKFGGFKSKGGPSPWANYTDPATSTCRKI